MRVLLLLSVLACSKDQPPPPASAPPEAGAVRGAFTLTYYWVSREADATGTPDTNVFDKTCEPLATVSLEFAKALAMSGTGQLVDGRTLTVTGECKCPRSPCFRVLANEASWGIGADNRPLVPYRSLAVDRDVIPIGTRLWIEQLAGVDLPGYVPTLHDGCVVADDTGGRMEGNKVDWFIGRKRDYLEIEESIEIGGTQVTLHDGGDRCP